MITNLIRLKNSRGFTIMELMITVVIIGLVAAMAAPSIGKSIDHFKFKSQTKELLSTLRKARSYAIAEKNPYGIYFDFDTYEMIAFKDIANPSNFIYDAGSDSIMSVDTVAGDYSYLYASFPNSAVIFQPNGTASQTGDIYMYSENDGTFSHSYLNVLASTGRSKVHYIYNY